MLRSDDVAWELIFKMTQRWCKSGRNGVVGHGEGTGRPTKGVPGYGQARGHMLRRVPVKCLRNAELKSIRSPERTLDNFDIVRGKNLKFAGQHSS